MLEVHVEILRAAKPAALRMTTRLATPALTAGRPEYGCLFSSRTLTVFGGVLLRYNPET
jgi:hypothetical protein